MEINYVKDVASGSYYIDTFTKTFVDEAWLLFLEIEEFGGYEKYVKAGHLDERIGESYQERMDQVVHREKVLVGTNQYADPSAETELTEGIVKLKKRLSAQYEEYWDYFNKQSFRAVLLLFGTLREVKGRADFRSEEHTSELQSRGH